MGLDRPIHAPETADGGTAPAAAGHVARHIGPGSTGPGSAVPGALEGTFPLPPSFRSRPAGGRS